jgi:hypothetical protein
MVNQITKMRLPDGTEVAFVDWEDQSIYSETVLNAIDVLNVTGAPGLPIPSMPQLQILNDSLVLRLWVSQKVMHEEKFGYYNPGFGVMGMGAMYPAATAVQRTYGSRGLPSQDAVRSLAMPVYMGGGETYYVSLDNFAGAAVDFGVLEGNTPTFNDHLVAKFAIHLDGLHKRPVS